MQRRYPQEAEAPGHDSFLDIVANIVGILIILVMVTGVRAKHWSQSEPPKETVSATAVALEEDRAAETSLRREMAGMIQQQRQLDAEIETQDRARMQLATALAAMEKETESRRSRLSNESRQDFLLRQELATAQAGLDRVQNEIRVVEQSEAPPTLIESYPTPLSKPVDDGEIHFQLKGGRIAFVPLKKLLDRFKEDAKRNLYKLRDLPEFTDTVGPDGGFRLRYTMARRDVSVEMQLAAGAGGVYAELDRWTLIPTDGQLGETTEEALAGGSRFREVLASYPADKTIVTIWAYQDSFADFSRLKKELFRIGFAAAGRPLPNDVPIGGSPQGTKSAAQ
jgi:hypothetical protein